MSSISPTLQQGLKALGAVATISVGTCIFLLFLIGYRSWPIRRSMNHGFIQCTALIWCLLFADLLQSLAFTISFHWIKLGGIVAPSSACLAQGLLLHFGDVSSGLFVLAIALHTCATLVLSKNVGQKAFVTIVVLIWIFALVLTVSGLIRYGYERLVTTVQYLPLTDAT